MIYSENSSTHSFQFNLIQKKAQPDIAEITIPTKVINALYKQALIAQKADTDTYGFAKGQTPLQYIENNFKPNIVEHLKELIFIHCILKYLYQSLCKHKIILIGDPILKDIYLEPNEPARFSFTLIKPTNCETRWKKLALKAPERKNYKDLDKQVESFLREETQYAQEYKDTSISCGDWVCFDLFMVDKNHDKLLGPYKDTLWVKMSNEEADKDLQDIFIGKNTNEVFYSDHSYFQNYVSNKLNMNYIFGIHIKDIVPHSYFSVDLFKHHFQLKNAKETHLKFIEVFSYRNDLTQRRETIEAAFKLLLKYYFLTLPKSTLERQKQQVLNQVHNNPDYLVYKAQADFKEKVRQLAEKQLKETILIDTIAYQENISVSHKDLVAYLNLIKRPRMKEFIYFAIPDTKINSQEIPFSEEILKQQCLREKTLNYVIKQLTKK